jgi:pyruvate oxidase
MSTKPAWHKVAEASELANGSLKPVVAGARTLVLARWDDRYSALEDRCPHAGGPLAEGSIEDGRLVCPWHGREFDLATGQCEGSRAVGVCRVEARADGIFVEA